MGTKIIEAEKIFKDFDLMVTFDTNGYRSGYIGIRPNNIFYGANHKILPVTAFGDLCFSLKTEEVLKNCINKSKYLSYNDWIIGFTTNHEGILKDNVSLKKYFPKIHLKSNNQETYFGFELDCWKNPKSLDFVMNECEIVAHELIRAEKRLNIIHQQNKNRIKSS